MRKFVVLPLVVAGSLALSGCFDGSSSTPRTDIRSDIIATGTVANGIAPLVLTDDGQRKRADSARVRVAHLSPAA